MALSRREQETLDGITDRLTERDPALVARLPRCSPAGVTGFRFRSPCGT